MKRFVALCVGASSWLVSASDLVPCCVAGDWRANWVAVAGERQTLKISDDMSSVFTRYFNDGRQQTFEAKEHKLVGDLLIFEYFSQNKSFSYKLVLSGWSRDLKKTLYGTMFMYQDGEQYNGLPVSFDNE